MALVDASHGQDARSGGKPAANGNLVRTLAPAFPVVAIRSVMRTGGPAMEAPRSVGRESPAWPRAEGGTATPACPLRGAIATGGAGPGVSLVWPGGVRPDGRSHHWQVPSLLQMGSPVWHATQAAPLVPHVVAS